MIMTWHSILDKNSLCYVLWILQYKTVDLRLISKFKADFKFHFSLSSYLLLKTNFNGKL